MRRRSVAGSFLLALLVAGTSMLGGGSASAAARELNSYNWSGYALRGPVMDAVVLEFTVPTVTCTQNRQALSIWAGFGGLVERSLVQAGVQVICEGTNPRYNLFEQHTTGTGASTEGPQVAPGDYVRVVICPGRAGASMGVCLPGAPTATSFMTSLAWKPAGTGDYRLWSESLVPKPWTNTRTEAECIVERPRDAATLELLDNPRFTPPALRCVPYRTVSPINRLNIAEGGGGYAAYRLSLVAGSPPEERAGTAPVAPGPLGALAEGDGSAVTATGSPGPATGQRVSSADGPRTGQPVHSSPMLAASQ